MPARSDDPLRRVTLNLYEADCVVLERHYGQGWTTVIRNTIHERMKVLTPSGPRLSEGDLLELHSNTNFRRTLGDLE